MEGNARTAGGCRGSRRSPVAGQTVPIRRNVVALALEVVTIGLRSLLSESMSLLSESMSLRRPPWSSDSVHEDAIGLEVAAIRSRELPLLESYFRIISAIQISLCGSTSDMYSVLSRTLKANRKFW